MADLDYETLNNLAPDSGSAKPSIIQNKKLFFEDLLLFAALFSLITLYGSWAWFTGDQSAAAFIPPFMSGYNMSGQSHLGGEYLNIARSVYEGDGFSNPFGDKTGPTGWSPPVLVYLMAFGLALGGGSVESLTVMFLAMQITVLSFTTALCVNFGRSVGEAKLALLAAAIVIIPNFKWLFQLTHDCVFVMLWVDLVFVGLVYFTHTKPTTTTSLLWGLLGGLCALSSPIVGFTWATSTTLVFGRKQWRHIILIGLVSLATVAPWMIYQSARLGTITPIKSNAGFERYQGQLVLPDGLIVESSYFVHPYWPESEQGKLYRQMGETNYIRAKQKQVNESIKSNPREYVRKSWIRLMAATVWFESEIEAHKARFGFVALRVLAICPFLGLVSLIAWRPDTPKWTMPAVCCYCLYLTPYILVGYYERYAIPLTLVRMVLTLWLFVGIKKIAVSKINKLRSSF